MQDTHHIAFLIPVTVGIAAVIYTIFIHVLPLSATINFVRREERLGRVGARFWMDTAIVARVMLYALVAHLVEIAFWTLLIVICREFSDFDTVCYHSAVNYVRTRRLQVLGTTRPSNNVVNAALTGLPPSFSGSSNPSIDSIVGPCTCAQQPAVLNAENSAVQLISRHPLNVRSQ